MGRKAVFSAVFAIGAVVVSACGGIDEPDLFSPAGQTSSSGDSGAGSKDGGGGSTVDGSTGGRDSGGGGGSDAGGGGIVDAGGGGGGGRDIFCGDTSTSTTCTGSDICCVRDNTLGSGLDTFACGTESSCTGDALGDLVIPCDDAHDCKGGAICCGVFVTNGSSGYYSSVSCQATCSDTSDRIFCDPARGNDDCVNGGSCVASGSMPGYHVCGT